MCVVASSSPWLRAARVSDAAFCERLLVGVGGDVDDAAAAAVRLGPPRRSMSTSSPVTERTTSGPVTKTRPLRTEDDDVGERRTVGGATGGGAQHDGDLRDSPGRPGHDVEDLTDGVQRDNALGEARAAGVPQADDRDVVGERPGVGREDDLAALGAHRAALMVASEPKATACVSVDQTVAGEHPGVVVGGELRRRCRRRRARASRFFGLRGSSARGIFGFLTAGVSLAVLGDGHEVAPEDQGDVVAAEAERVVEGDGAWESICRPACAPGRRRCRAAPRRRGPRG